MKIWPVQDAKAKFSEMLETCVSEGPQMVSKRGIIEAVLVPVAEWEKLKAEQPLTLKDLLLMPGPPRDLYIPPRGRLIAGCMCSIPMCSRDSGGGGPMGVSLHRSEALWKQTCL